MKRREFLVRRHHSNVLRVVLGAMLVALCVLLHPMDAHAFDLACNLSLSTGSTASITAQDESDGTYLFLPSQADVSSLLLSSGTGPVEAWSWVTGSYVDVSGGADLVELGVFPSVDATQSTSKLWIRLGGSVEAPITVMKSANICSVFVSANHDISYVNSSANHSVSDSGTVTVLSPDSTDAVYEGGLDAIRGRGNTTWAGSAKKPYQMKLSKKADLLGTGEKTKTWLLLANAADPTLLRNTLSYKLAIYMGSAGTPSCEPCDLYYNGEYRGSYLLTEKVKVEKNGVNIDDLDEANEDANAGSSAWENPWANRQWSVNSRGAEFSYVAGLTSPDDVTGGYLVELDDKASRSDEVSMFYSKTHFFTVHTPEYATYDEALYVSELMGASIDAAINGGVDPVTGAKAEDLFDIDSLLATGLTQDFVAEGDYLFSSSYFYVPRASNKVYVGPVWDCDRSFDLTRASSSSAFAQSFLSGNPAMLAKAGEVFRSRLYPVVWSVLLGDANAQTADGSLHSLAYYRNQIAASQAMDQKIWGIAPLNDEWVSYVKVDGKTWSSYVDDLATYMTRRLSYQYDFYRQSNWKYCSWRGTSIDTWVPYVDGKPQNNGWVMDGLNWYYMSSGRLCAGWLNQNGTWYWLDPSTGAMATGWFVAGSNWYYANTSGKMRTSWLNYGGEWYWLDASGVMTRGWRLVDDTWYCFGPSGKMLSGWQYVGGSWYLLGGPGDGAMRTGWQYVDGVWYYLGSNGAMTTGWQLVGSAWYYLSGSGVMQTGWINLGGTWYWLDEGGAMATGWRLVNGTWYFMDASGAMAHDRWVGDYYVTSSGAMATSQWIGPWWVGADGRWVA